MVDPASGGTPLQRVEPATPLRELCCASCSLPAAPQGKAVAALPTPRASMGGGGNGGGGGESGGARIGMLVPLRTSAFWWGVRFAQSMLACGQQAAHVFLPVLSTTDERDMFVAKLAAALPAAALRGARAQPGWLVPLVAAEDARNPPVAKKLRALQAAFASASPALSYVVALDAEAEFTSRAPPWAALERWVRERTALGWAHGRGEAGGLWDNISAASCALAGVPRPQPARLLWWADAPVYERADWADFYGRVRANWERRSMLQVVTYLSPPRRCPSSTPAPPQGAPGGPVQLGTPRVRPSHRGTPATALGAQAS